jgi:hypothetical protein
MVEKHPSLGKIGKFKERKIKDKCTVTVTMAQELPDRLSDEVTGMRAAGLMHAVIGKLEVALIGRATYAAGL